MLSWRVTFTIGSVHPLQAVPFPNIWKDLQQGTAFMACQVSLQKCNPFQRQRASFCKGFFFFFFLISILPLLPNVLLEKNSFSEKKKPAFTMHQAFGRPKKMLHRTSLNPTFQLTRKWPWILFKAGNSSKIKLGNSKLGHVARGCGASPTSTGIWLLFDTWGTEGIPSNALLCWCGNVGMQPRGWAPSSFPFSLRLVPHVPAACHGT